MPGFSQGRKPAITAMSKSSRPMEIPWTELSRISDDEMKRLMTEIVNRVFTYLSYPDELAKRPPRPKNGPSLGWMPNSCALCGGVKPRRLSQRTFRTKAPLPDRTVGMLTSLKGRARACAQSSNPRRHPVSTYPRRAGRVFVQAPVATAQAGSPSRHRSWRSGRMRA